MKAMQVENEARKSSRKKVTEANKLAKALQLEEGSDIEEDDERRLSLSLSESQSSQEMDDPTQLERERGNFSESSSCTPANSGTESYNYR